jgi:hypothetical protein
MENFEEITAPVDYEKPEIDKERGRIGCGNYDLGWLRSKLSLVKTRERRLHWSMLRFRSSISQSADRGRIVNL